MKKRRRIAELEEQVKQLQAEVQKLQMQLTVTYPVAVPAPTYVSPPTTVPQYIRWPTIISGNTTHQLPPDSTLLRH